MNRSFLLNTVSLLVGCVFPLTHLCSHMPAHASEPALPMTAAENVVGNTTASKYDLVIYGGTASAITAAIQAKRMGQSVVVVSPDKHLGGLTSGGLGWTDSGRKEVVGGLAKEFYQEVYEHYQKDESWSFQSRDEYGNRAQGHRASDDEKKTMWVFEPHVAEGIFDRWVKENTIPVHRNAWLDREAGVKKEGNRIVEIRTLDGNTFSGKMFVDATYEGDLIAAAGVETTYGREGVADYDEPHAGVQTGVLHHSHHFDVLEKRVDPYVVPGDPSSGVIALVSPDPPGEFGSADKRVQAYCFRTCMTNHDPNRVPFPKPDGYAPDQYEVLLRCFAAGWRNVDRKFDPLPNFKTDTNNHGPVSFDNIGKNYDYPEATYARRRKIIAEHETYQKGMLYFMANDPRVPEDIRTLMQSWGLAKDEFLDNDNWPHQLYVREARRMVGEFVMTENHLRKDKPTPDSVGMGSYTIDSHNIQRYITEEGYVQNEGDIGVSTNGPYQIAMGSLLPKKSQCENLLSPVCVSSTHMAFGSIRMEPVFMILGQSAATIASLANRNKSAVQDVRYDEVHDQLLADKQILDTPPDLVAKQHSFGVSVTELPGITLDDRDAKLSGGWTSSRSSTKFAGQGYLHDGNDNQRRSTAEFSTVLPQRGAYHVHLIYPPHSNRSKQTHVTVHHAGGFSEMVINQSTIDSSESKLPLKKLGTFDFDDMTSAKVVVSNRDANGYVVVDAVNWQLAP